MAIDFPISFTQGDSFTFKTILTDYPTSSGYELHLAIRGLSSADLEASISEEQYVFAFTTSITASLTPGVYKATFYLVKAAERITLQTTNLEVLEDPILMGNIDMRSHEEIMLDAIEAFMQNRATKGQLDHLMTEIDGKKLERMNMLELIQLRDYYKAKVMSFKNQAPRKFLYQFTR